MSTEKEDPVYLDYNATTPVAPEVADAIEPYLREHFGNASSSHVYGQRAKQALEQAREEVAATIGAKTDEIIFTGSATEANNLAILGTARALAGRKKHLITSAIEHPSVMKPFVKLRDEGWEISILPVDSTGRVDPQDVERAFRPNTALVSIMHANNEVGTIQPIAEIARLVRPRGIALHTDAAQSMGKIDVNVHVLGVDLLTLAGHKFYAPKGVGALYVRHGTPLKVVFAGAGHEQGLRPGTENIAFIAGFAAALKLIRERPVAGMSQLKAMRDQLHQKLTAEIPGLLLNGSNDARLPNTLNVSFPGVSGHALLAAAAEDVAASTGSACHAGQSAESGVLGAMGLDAERAAGAVRLSIGTSTTPAEIARAANALIAAWRLAKTSS
ncbi:MAG: cysteine desulfurase family protein [Sulfuricellaceae bacterium]|nr:cysteine desulfurase family protein [Sulfuricellaceae bacterium]